MATAAGVYVSRRRPKWLMRAALLTAAIVLSYSPTRGSAQDSVLAISMFDLPAKFKPETATIKVGQSVKWLNDGDTVHTVTTDPSQAPDPRWVSVPTGAEQIDSGYLKPGDSYTYTFKIAGLYRYFCLTHEEEGMRGEVRVSR